MAPLSETHANRATRLARNAKRVLLNPDSTIILDNKENAAPKPTSKPPTTTSTITSTTPKKRPAASTTTTTTTNDADTTANSNTSTHINDDTSSISSISTDASLPIRWNANQIRTKIDTFLRNTGMKLTDFDNKLKISGHSRRTFMGQSGPTKGIESDTYAAAHGFFSKREERGLGMPRAKRARTGVNVNKGSDQKHEGSPRADDLLHLDGEGTASIPIYDTCNDVRTKINAHLRKKGTTKASFAREISKCQAANSTPITPEQITTFLRKNGPLAGNSSKAFYASYVYFEKVRVKEGRPKTKKRMEMEGVHGGRGVMTDRAIESIGFKQPVGRKVGVDKFGHPRNSAGTW